LRNRPESIPEPEMSENCSPGIISDRVMRSP
jgi:hypothetical protein